jgi:hypothetical protein
MIKTIFLLVPGICDWRSIWGGRGWETQAALQINRDTDFKAMPFRYAVGAIGEHFFNRDLALEFSRWLRYYSIHDWTINIIAHSNGTIVATKGLRMTGWPKVKSLHLVAGACDSDFEVLGLNEAIKTRHIQSVVVWRGGKDMAMRIEDTILGKWLFGIRTRSAPLGLVGAFRAAFDIPEVFEPDYGHSDWFLKRNWDKTMGLLLA